MGWMHWPDCSTLQKCPYPQEEQSYTWAQPRPSRGSGHGPMPEHPPKRQSSFYPRGFFKRKHRTGSLLCISGPWWNIAHGYEILHQLEDGRNILIVPVFHGKPKRNPNCRFFFLPSTVIIVSICGIVPPTQRLVRGWADWWGPKSWRTWNFSAAAEPCMAA